jgi:hypothetical protein
MKDFKYSFLLENCQTFALETLKLLSVWDPKLVSSKTVDMARKNAAIATRHARPRRVVNGARPRFTSMENANDRIGGSESADVFNPAIAVLPRDDEQRGGRRTGASTSLVDMEK